MRKLVWLLLMSLIFVPDVHANFGGGLAVGLSAGSAGKSDAPVIENTQREGKRFVLLQVLKDSLKVFDKQDRIIIKVEYPFHSYRTRGVHKYEMEGFAYNEGKTEKCLDMWKLITDDLFPLEQ